VITSPPEQMLREFLFLASERYAAVVFSAGNLAGSCPIMGA
jgi:hypothetical protein